MLGTIRRRFDTRRQISCVNLLDLTLDSSPCCTKELKTKECERTGSFEGDDGHARGGAAQRFRAWRHPSGKANLRKSPESHLGQRTARGRLTARDANWRSGWDDGWRGYVSNSPEATSRLAPLPVSYPPIHHATAPASPMAQTSALNMVYAVIPKFCVM